MRVSEDRVFDLMVELVDFAGGHGLPRTALALEGALDAFLQDRGLAPKTLPAPRILTVREGPSGPVQDHAPLSAPIPRIASGAAGHVARDDGAAVPAAVHAALVAPDAALDGAAFRTRRPVTQPRRLHLLPSQRIPV